MRELKEKWIPDFIALGAEVEHNGVKVRPETTTSIAIGKISRLDEVGKNNLKLTLKVSGAKYDFSGFLNDNTPVAGLLKQAKEEDLVICARFEKKRKKGVDPTLPIADITVDASTAKDNIVKVVSGVYNFNTEEWILTDDAVSNPAEDPANVKTELDNASYSTEGFFSSTSTSSSAPKVPTTDVDRKANHLISMYSYASEHNQENKLDFDDNALKILASYMLTACDQLQMKSYSLEAPNYSDYSHTKARGMLFSWMKLNPLSKEIMTTKGAFNTWITRFLTESSDIWAWAKSEAEK